MSKIIKLAAAMACLLFAAVCFAQDSAYVTPDSWSKHVTANGVQASSNGITAGGANIKLGLTTRERLRFYDGNDVNIFQYARARAAGIKLGNGEVVINLNVRGAWDSRPNANENEKFVFYNGLDVSRGISDVDFRLYQGNVEFNGVIPMVDLALGRIYLPVFDSYKLDGANIAFSPVNWLKINAYYGLPVSYYSDVNTQLAGAGLDMPIDKTGTRIRAGYSYFMNDEDDLDTMIVKGRIDQNVMIANVYAEGSMVGRAKTYEVGLDGYIDQSKTSFSGYVKGQYDQNMHDVNPYAAMFESELGVESEYFMGGVELTQGITEWLMIALGFEGRYNYDQYYGDRDYRRVFGEIDLSGLIHRNNYISVIADYYTVDSYKDFDKNSKLLVGLRMTQKITDALDAYLGANVQNYQFRATPIKYAVELSDTGYPNLEKQTRNTTLAYIGASWKPVEWCSVQLDYTFEYSEVFKDYNIANNMSQVEAWVNFLW